MPQGQPPRIDLNRASAEELRAIEGIGTRRAQAIVRYREENGGFMSIDDLDRVPGFARKMVHVVKRQEGIVVGRIGGRAGQPAATAAAGDTAHPRRSTGRSPTPAKKSRTRQSAARG